MVEDRIYLKNLVTELANLRNDKAEYEEKYKRARANLGATKEFQTFENAKALRSEASSDVRQLEVKVRELATDIYADSAEEDQPDKAPHPAVSIVIGKDFVMAGDRILLRYCINHLHLCLRVDEEKLIAIAKATGDIVGDNGLYLVASHDDPKARIKSDLSKWETE